MNGFNSRGESLWWQGESDAHRVWPSGAFLYFADEKIPEGDTHQDCFFRLTKKPQQSKSKGCDPVDVDSAGDPTARSSFMRCTAEVDLGASIRCGVTKSFRSIGASPEMTAGIQALVLNYVNAQRQRIIKAEAHCLLMRCLAESKMVKVIGSGAGRQRFEWYRRKQDMDHRCGT